MFRISEYKDIIGFDHADFAAISCLQWNVLHICVIYLSVAGTEQLQSEFGLLWHSM